MSTEYQAINLLWNNAFRRIYNCCLRESTSSLPYSCSCLPLSLITDQQSVLFYRHRLTSCSTTLRILVNHKQGFILSLLEKCNTPSLLLLRDTIKRGITLWVKQWMLNISVFYMYHLCLCLCNCSRCWLLLFLFFSFSMFVLLVSAASCLIKPTRSSCFRLQVFIVGYVNLTRATNSSRHIDLHVPCSVYAYLVTTTDTKLISSHWNISSAEKTESKWRCWCWCVCAL